MSFINGKTILIVIISLLSLISIIAGIVTVTPAGKGVYYFLNPAVWNCTTAEIADCKQKLDVAQAAGRNWIGAWFFVTGILLTLVAIFTGFATEQGGKLDDYIASQHAKTA